MILQEERIPVRKEPARIPWQVRILDPTSGYWVSFRWMANLTKLGTSWRSSFRIRFAR